MHHDCMHTCTGKIPYLRTKYPIILLDKIPRFNSIHPWLRPQQLLTVTVVK